ncbi:hypothetical protein SAMN05421823_10440 [Catalinimonas alkaloidigena]|uniref:Uncharacterized protein n=1 Tax=Catalinimonas alkaloidigena TaxID=1075417 RepID=A0A1G9GAC5_9BACT|nr:hypothetical protein SAMN05421823_10440 [Catalinimonas alkaloidigena]
MKYQTKFRLFEKEERRPVRKNGKKFSLFL